TLPATTLSLDAYQASPLLPGDASEDFWMNIWSCSAGLRASRQEDTQLSVKGEDGQLYHWILPSFFQLIRDLAQEGREFAIVFRTFGTDLPRVLRAVSRAVKEGAHPLFPDLPELKVRQDHSKTYANMTSSALPCRTLYSGKKQE
ncbi:hypothetical protein GOODEAATRI_008988, partial [Goodea atripinnis]